MRRSPMRLAGGAVTAAAVAVVGLTVTACGPVKMGAAAITGSDRISSSSLASQVSNLNAGYQASKPKVQLQFPAGQMPQQVLGWLLRFRVRDQLAAREHIVVTPGDSERALAQIQQQLSQNGSSATLTDVAIANGLPPDLLPELGTYQAVQNETLDRLDGGTQPTTSAGIAALEARFNQVECQAAKSLNIQVNPQYGQLDYNGYSVVPAPSGLSSAEPSPGASPSASPGPSPVLSPPC